MCGRFTLSQSAAAIAEAFELADVPSAPSRYNIAPSQPVAVVLKTLKNPERHYRLMRWGLIPAWAKDPVIGNHLINARSESVAEKPSFRGAFKYRRCLIVADGFYEWKKLSRGKQPYYFHLKHRKLFAFAGLWESWNDIETCTLLTTTANERLAPFHERMPVILNPKDYDLWLDPTLTDSKSLQPLLKPFHAEEMIVYPVDIIVNKPANDTPECIQPLQELS
jgi:putative SOS response-associated peptidase YedK